MCKNFLLNNLLFKLKIGFVFIKKVFKAKKILRDIKS